MPCQMKTSPSPFRSLISDDAVYILEDMDAEDQEEILSRLPHEERMISSVP